MRIIQFVHIFKTDFQLKFVYRYKDFGFKIVFKVFSYFHIKGGNVKLFFNCKINSQLLILMDWGPFHYHLR